MQVTALHRGNATAASHAGAARMAQEAGVQKLVLVHMGPHVSAHGPLEKGLGEIAALYDGEVVFGEGVMRIEL